MKRNLVMTLCAVIFISALFQSGFSAGGPYYANCPVGKNLEVNLTYTENVEDQFSDRELEDQAKDWFLFGLLLNSGLKDGEVNEITYDLAPVRYDFLEPVFNFEYGETRSAFIGNREIVAIIPKCSANERLDYLAHIADEHRKNQHEIPKKIYVFQYQIDLDDYFAIVTRLEDQNAELLYTPQYGYFQTTLTSLSDLENFMAKTEDLTYAAIRPDGEVEVGGRKLKNRHYGTITPEDVATIWQAEDKLEKDVSSFNKVDSIGFSLDTAYDVTAIERLIEGDWQAYAQRTDIKKNPNYRSGVLKKPTGTTLKRLIKNYGFNRTDILDGFAQNDELPFLKFYLKLFIDNPELAFNYRQLIRGSLFQKARYDGDLQGTRVGMNFFYTDLLLKLWFFNFNKLAPINHICEFRTYLNTNLSVSFKTETEKLHAGRSWLAPNEGAFQLSNNRNRILFPRNIVKVFIKSSEHLFANQEFEASPIRRSVRQWWNSHFEEIAQYESEYERLNENFKWSTVISWLFSKGMGSHLEFLDEVSIRKNFWFPNWAAHNKNLKFHKWNYIKFSPKNCKDLSTEAFPHLHSPVFYLWGKGFHFSGGVSNIGKARMNKLVGLSKRVKTQLRSSKINYKNWSNTELVTHSGTRFTLGKTGKLTNRVITTPTPKTKLTSSFGEFRNGQLIREISNKPGLLEVKTGYQSVDFSKLSISNSKNGFDCRMATRGIDDASYIARNACNSSNPIQYLKSNPGVKSIKPLGPGRGYLVEMKKSGLTAEMRVVENSGKALSESSHIRVSGQLPKSPTIEVRITSQNVKSIRSNPVQSAYNRFCNGIEKIKNGKLDAGNRIANNALNPRGVRPENFWEEVCGRIHNNSTIPKYQQRILQKYQRFRMSKNFEYLRVRFKNIPGGKKISPERLFSENGPKRLFIQDHPSLNKIDFSINLRQTVPKVPQTYPRAVLKEIPLKSLDKWKVRPNFTGKKDVGYLGEFDLVKGYRGTPIPLGVPGEDRDSKDDSVAVLYFPVDEI